MDVQFYGANCVVLSSKQIRIVVDDNLADLGAKSVTKEGDVVLFTGDHGEPSATPKIIIDQPGEYEIQGISVYGISARGHTDETAQKHTATMYKLICEDISILVTGHVYPELSEEELESIGLIDIMLVPVGGNGYTLDPIGALNLIKKIEPKLVIPTHYADKDLKFPVPQTSLADALKELPIEVKDTITKLKIKPADLSDVMQITVLEKP
jgi:L-ascorbate metabolism protein UlaG (beta-lactamase superfamily)